jgi:hypothetical protein
MYENGTLRPDETVLRGEKRIKENDEGGESEIHCKNFYKC